MYKKFNKIDLNLHFHPNATLDNGFLMPGTISLVIQDKHAIGCQVSLLVKQDSQLLYSPTAILLLYLSHRMYFAQGQAILIIFFRVTFMQFT